MKKYVVCGIALCWLSGSFVCSDAFAESYSLTDFLFGRQSTSERGHGEARAGSGDGGPGNLQDLAALP